MESTRVTVKPEHSTYSSHELIVIPKDYKFIPNEAQFKEAITIVENLYPEHELNFEAYDSVIFVDSGENFEKVICNHCGKYLEIDFWQQKMTECYEGSNFENLTIETSCCNKTTSLNELVYEGDCGFASYSISINNAEADVEKETRLNDSLSNLINTGMKVFWRHT